MIGLLARGLRAGLALAVGGAVGAAVLEIGLRIHNPIPLRVRGKQIALPVNKRVIYRNPFPRSKIDPTVVVTRNSLGFRGSDPPRDFAAHRTFLAIGGSTTECRFLSDDRTWPARLEARLSHSFDRVWVGNAGFDGHSTFGHLVLMKQVVLGLHPDHLLLLVGANDVGRADLNEFDLSIDPAHQSLRDRWIARSELLSTIQVLYRSLRAFRLGLGHLWELDLRTAPTGVVSELEIERTVAFHRRSFIGAYRGRLERLVELALGAGIEPILITQPALFSDGRDPATGVAIGPVLYAGETAALRWRVLDAYNDETRAVGAEHGLLVIDAARDLPHDSRLFYDWMHYTNAGAEALATLVGEQLVPHLKGRSDG